MSPVSRFLATSTLLLAPALGFAQADLQKAQLCVSCHGPGGNSVVTTIPSLAGQSARYLYLQMVDFQEGRRKNRMMAPMIAGLSRDDLREIADYFAASPPKPTGFTPDPVKAKAGKAKADETLCTMCHQGGFAGMNEVPRVAGQHYDYVVKQLSDFKAHTRNNDAGTMTAVAGTLSDQDIDNLAHYVAGL